MGSVSGRSPSCSQACASGSGAHTPQTRDERVNRRRCTALHGDWLDGLGVGQGLGQWGPARAETRCWLGGFIGEMERVGGDGMDVHAGWGIEYWTGADDEAGQGQGRLASQVQGLAMTRRSIWRTDKLPEGLGAFDGGGG